MRALLIHGTIERLLQVNYRIKPAVAAAWLDESLRPRLISGWAVGGLALVRLADVRPRFLPPWFGLCSENLLHWIAVAWDEGGQTRVGTCVLRRDSDSRLGALAGGRLFRGDHHHASFDVHESVTRIDATAHADDGCTRLELVAGGHTHLPERSLFSSAYDAANWLDVAAAMPFEGVGLARRVGDFEVWRVCEVQSHFFSDPARFPPGSVELDSAILMRGLRRRPHRRRRRANEARAVLVEAHA